MSLYNALFGTNDKAHLLFHLLGIKPEDVPRFRDIYWNGVHIVIHTRTGGGNREAYEEENEALTKVDGYDYDEDDSFDSTYADFYYTPSEEALELLKEMNTDVPPSEKWQKVFAAMKGKPGVE